MLTPFGKTVRKIRIDLGITLKSMAEAMGMTSSYLSAIETGKRTVTKPILDSIINFFNASPEQKEELLKAARDSQQTVEINLSGRGENARQVAMAFARNFDELSDTDFAKLRNLLNKNNK
ncbi:helix-turn-helix domain-containing protein [Edaphovirga cremea]|uniref:helix-turn-helix domain-containing protein n=1 Tax=Edaphovirga cremea TaxID=2267246 RepID=UPI000DEF2B21|nr:helix-turn-helix transcriptional regulator [Edaphovirga cremea]